VDSLGPTLLLVPLRPTVRDAAMIVRGEGVRAAAPVEDDLA
jgi:hypothetical protein